MYFIDLSIKKSVTILVGVLLIIMFGLVAKSALENIIATKIPTSETISEFDASICEVANLDALQEEMMQNRSEIKAMIFKSKSLVAQRDAVEGKYMPNVDLLARYDLNDKEKKLVAKSAKENYRIISDRYNYGDVDTLTLLVSQTSLTQVTNAHNDAYYNLYVAYKTLCRVVGE